MTKLSAKGKHMFSKDSGHLSKCGKNGAIIEINTYQHLQLVVYRHTFSNKYCRAATLH